MAVRLAEERLYLTADRSRVVKRGDPAAAFLWKSVGKPISDAEATEFGLDGAKPAATARPPRRGGTRSGPTAPAETKEVAAPEGDKEQAAPDGDKAAEEEQTA